MSTIAITAADVNKLRQQTGAGMMDCKKALTEASGDFEAAVDYLRKKGQKIAVNRSDKEANEGVIIAKTTPDGKRGVMIAVNCETDFVAKNGDFISSVTSFLDLAVAKNPGSLEELQTLQLPSSLSVNDALLDMMAKIGEKITLSRYEVVEAPHVTVYNHPGYKLASMAGLSSEGSSGIAEAGKEIAMQIAAMGPVAIDRTDVDPRMLERELEIAREQARQEGKPAEMLEKIAQGKLNKFYKENTLLNQSYIKDEKKTVAQYLDSVHKGLTVTAFRRMRLGA